MWPVLFSPLCLFSTSCSYSDHYHFGDLPPGILLHEALGVVSSAFLTLNVIGVTLLLLQSLTHLNTYWTASTSPFWNQTGFFSKLEAIIFHFGCKCPVSAVPHQFWFHRVQSLHNFWIHSGSFSKFTIALVISLSEKSRRLPLHLRTL